MHFQPLEEIAENLEESGSRHPNMALFHRLLNVGPTSTGLMGGALRRTSAQLQRLRHSPSIDQCTTDEEDNDSSKIGKGGSLPSGLGQESQSTVCSLKEEKSFRTPLLDIQFGSEQSADNQELRIEEDGDSLKQVEETHAPLSLFPTPLQLSKKTRPVSAITSHHSAYLSQSNDQSNLEHCSSQPVINYS